MNGTDRHEDQPSRRHRRLLGLLAVGAVLVGVPTVWSGASFTSSSKSTGKITAASDWMPPTIELDDPGVAIRGTVTLSATATDPQSGIVSVAFAWSPSGEGAYTTLCTDTAAPYTCAWNTVPLGDDEVDLRAIATDGAGFTNTDFVDGVTIDNTAPTGAIGTLADPLSGTVTIPVTATDATSGVVSVTVQSATAGLGNWSTICTDVDLPYSCRFTTNGLVGSVDLRALITDAAGNTFTTPTVRRTVNNVVDSVSMEDPGTYLRGTATLNASASAALGVRSVTIQRQLVGTSTWTDVCVDTTAPYSCAWATTTVPDGQYVFRALLINSLGATTATSLTVGPAQVDNTVVRGYDVQSTNATSPGKLATGDAISLTYTQPMRPGSILAGWDGTARTVTVRFRDGQSLGLTNTNDTMDVLTSTNPVTAINLGSVNTKGNLVRKNKTVSFSATMVMSSATVNGVSASRITLTLVALSSGAASNLRTTSTPANMVWTPSALALDTTGAASSTAAVTELGTLDVDF